MPDEPKKEHSEDIQSILSDLDAILTDMGGTPKPPAAAPPPPAAEVKLPAKPVLPIIEAAKAAPIPIPPPPPPPPTLSPSPPPPPAPLSPPPPPPPQAQIPPSIELAPREGMIKPPEHKSEPQKPIELTSTPVPKAPEPVMPVAVVKPVEPTKPPPPSPVAVPAPVPVVASTAITELPANTPKEQIRRVAYIHTGTCGEAKVNFAAFLSQAARTISKKPLFLREVLSHEITAASDPNAIVEKARQVKAVAILGVVEGWPSAKVDELSEACSRANLLFKSVAPAETLKKSTAVDIIVDMMLLSGES